MTLAESCGGQVLRLALTSVRVGDVPDTVPRVLGNRDRGVRGPSATQAHGAVREDFDVEFTVDFELFTVSVLRKLFPVADVGFEVATVRLTPSLENLTSEALSSANHVVGEGTRDIDAGGVLDDGQGASGLAIETISVLEIPRSSIGEGITVPPVVEHEGVVVVDAEVVLSGVGVTASEEFTVQDGFEVVQGDCTLDEEGTVDGAVGGIVEGTVDRDVLSIVPGVDGADSLAGRGIGSTRQVPVAVPVHVSVSLVGKFDTVDIELVIVSVEDDTLVIHGGSSGDVQGTVDVVTVGETSVSESLVGEGGTTFAVPSTSDDDLTGGKHLGDDGSDGLAARGPV